MRNTRPFNPIPAMTMAICGAAIVATGMMFIPVGVLEGFIGPTGLSELFPALSAPLGDGVRALIAYGAGVTTLGWLTVFLLQNDRCNMHQQTDLNANGRRTFGLNLKHYLPGKMPWVQKTDDIRTLGDLSRLGIDDGTSDAAPRPPLLASQDLPPLGLVEPIFDGDSIQAAIKRHILPTTPEPVAEVASDLQAEPKLTEMVDRFESAVTQRQQKLVQIEASLMEESKERADELELPEQADVVPAPDSNVRRPVLELVPSTAVADDDADSGLAAALATLHRMTANAR